MTMEDINNSVLKITTSLQIVDQMVSDPPSTQGGLYCNLMSPDDETRAEWQTMSVCCNIPGCAFITKPNKH